MPSAGETIAGKYRLERELGRGGMGVVFEATNVATEARVAIKFLEGGAGRSEEIAARFMREAKAAGRLRSRYVARVFDADRTAAGEPFIVMELLRGMDMAALLDRGRLSVERACSLLVQACAGVDDAHREGIVHRDLKPANLFLATEGNEVVKVLDFGVSKLSTTEGPQQTSSKAILGTLAYMSPEHFADARSVDARADVWALGVILFSALEGRRPFPGDGPSLIAAVVTPQRLAMKVTRADAPPALVDVVAHCLEKNRDARISSVAELAELLVPFASAAAVSDALAEIRTRRHPVTALDGAPALDAMSATLTCIGDSVSPAIPSAARHSAYPSSDSVAYAPTSAISGGIAAPTLHSRSSLAQGLTTKANATMLVVLGALGATTILLGILLLSRRGMPPPPVTAPAAEVAQSVSPPPPPVSIILLPAPPTAPPSSSAPPQGAVKSKPAALPAHRPHDAGATKIPTLL